METLPAVVKRCTKCDATKTLDEFGKHNGRKDGRQSHCRACAGKANRARLARQDPAQRRAEGARRAREWRARNPEANLANMRKWRLATGFGITVEEYDRLLVAQGGVCALCSKPEEAIGRGGVVKMLAVDHDHASGAVRGLLCQRCNLALGLLGDDPAGLQRALEYVTARR